MLNEKQLSIIGVLFEGECSGRELRQSLKELGRKQGGPAFYRMMSRLEDSGLVEGRYEVVELDENQSVRQRRYSLTGKGIRSFEKVLDQLTALRLAGGTNDAQ